MGKARIRVGIGSCLLSQKVRFDGGLKLDTLITETLGRYFEWVPVCPEMGIGLGAPRGSLRLIADAGNVRLIATKSGTNNSDKHYRRLAQMVADLGTQRMCEVLRVRPASDGKPAHPCHPA